MKSLMRFVLGTGIILLVAYLTLDYGSTWRISNQKLDRIVSDFNVIEQASKFSKDLSFDIGLKLSKIAPKSKIIHKSRLEGIDALANAFSLYVSCFTVIPFFFILLLVIIFYALFSSELVGAIVGLIIGALMLVVVPLYPVGLWLALLFQEATSDYYVLWSLMGLPAIGLGFASIPATYYYVTVIIIRIK